LNKVGKTTSKIKYLITLFGFKMDSMQKKVLSSYLCIMLIGTLFTLMLITCLPGNVKADVLYVLPGESIQQEINNASVGDTVYISSGTYYENITITKAIKLVGQNKLTTIIDGLNAERVISINNIDDVNISSLTIKNGNRGIYVYSSDHITIEKVKISECKRWGIYAYSCNDLSISDNIFSGLGTGDGIEAYGAKDLEIKGNQINHFINGSKMIKMNEVEIQENTFYNNSNSGLNILGSSIIIESTTIELSKYGVYFADHPPSSSVSIGTIYNSSITSSYTADFFVGLKQLTVVNTSFDYNSVIVSKSNAILILKNYLEVYVKDSQENPVSNADVIVKDDGNKIYDSTTGDNKTDENGLISLIEVVYRDYVYDSASDYKIMESITSIQSSYKSVDLAYLGVDPNNIDMSTSHRETFQLDTIPPDLPEISSHGNISLSPNTIDRKMDDSLAIIFEASEPGDYIIIINTSGDNEFIEGNDTVLRGIATGNLQTVYWHGSNESGIFPDGIYYVEIILIDEFNNTISEPYTAMIIRIINTDSDGDGSIDIHDDFPDDPTQWSDNDSDGYGDNGTGLKADAFPNDGTQWADSDGDGYGDNPEGNNPDAFPDDSTQWLDTDGDGYGDNPLGNKPDAFPYDPTQWSDSDGDGYGDNETGNDPDAFPNDKYEWNDYDGDGYGDNGDDAFPRDPKEWKDTDGDGMGDNSDFLPTIHNWLLFIMIGVAVVVIIAALYYYKRVVVATRPFEPGVGADAGVKTPSQAMPPAQPARMPVQARAPAQPKPTKKPVSRPKRVVKPKPPAPEEPIAPPPPPPLETTKETPPPPPKKEKEKGEEND
jgi:parallel beta-helix repeat protein